MSSTQATVDAQLGELKSGRASGGTTLSINRTFIIILYCYIILLLAILKSIQSLKALKDV